MEKGKINYQLTKGKRPPSWQLPIKNVLLEKFDGRKSLGKRKLEYIPGNPSIFKEDHNSDEEDAPVWFEDGVLQVDTSDTALAYLLDNHPWNSVHFEKVDHDVTAQQDIDVMDLRIKAYEAVSSSDENEMRARAYVLVGPQVIDQSDKVVAAQLKTLAFEDPESVLEEMNNPNYKPKTVAALAILRGVLQINPTNTAVSWAKTGKVVIQVAVGQSPIQKLGEFLAGKDEAAKITLQTIGAEIKRSYTFKEDYTAKQELKDVLGDEAPDEPELPVKDEDSLSELQLAKEEYEDTVGKSVPNNKKSDLAWIKNKIAEQSQEDNS